ncbi:hypothetical protein BC939DRAFT_439464 [Gamsiella multidivaricata]|uniref:uncharacterized protein n=1 Tax=Gamsiella multidivaricata TaxID=101098 RepID=UPI00221E66DF|nr:uncharacterized protein BC939DRAFT_439464 [Gamsiella multidivaricata]KAI7830480.1 hypothetical protein BC939DRAFT_439464 [Gamsiella multidivaricata]
MIIPSSHQGASTVQDSAVLSIAINAESSIHPSSRRAESISLFLPVLIIAMFLLILGLTGILARCLYRRFKALRHTSPSPSATSSSWKSYYAQNHNNNPDLNLDNDADDDEQGEQERLLARRRSTSYYDANRSRAPVAVVIQHDAKGRPISTWSTASSVAAQRGEELSRWSRRRDDLIKIYGRSSNLNSGSYIGEGNGNDSISAAGLEEDPEQELEQEREYEHEQELEHEQQEHAQGHEHSQVGLANGHREDATGAKSNGQLYGAA